MPQIAQQSTLLQRDDCRQGGRPARPLYHRKPQQLRPMEEQLGASAQLPGPVPAVREHEGEVSRQRGSGQEKEQSQPCGAEWTAVVSN